MPTMNILEVLESATGYFTKNNVESPRLNAEHLLAHILKCRRLDLYLQFDRPVSELERAPLRDLVKRRIAGEPLQHLLGSWDFYGREFAVDRRALIPRPETELLAEKVLEALPKEGLRVLDCGTGSGILALTLALERPQWQLSGVDVSAAALSLAQENHTKLGTPPNVVFLEADLLPPESTWDAIVANLPYIPSAEIPGLSAEVLHDPVSALDGGPDGLHLIRRLLPMANAALQPPGAIFLEFGAGQEGALQSLLGETGFCNIQIHKDQQCIPRIAEARKTF